MRTTGIEWKTVDPPHELTDFVESFWMIANRSEEAHQIILLPDGRIDLLFFCSAKGAFRGTLKGLETSPAPTIIPAYTHFFAVSLKLLAAEYVIDSEIQSLLNKGMRLPRGFWDITRADLDDFSAFCKKVTAKLNSLIKPDIDERKRNLFHLIYVSNGTLTVKELSEKVFWSSRQINRYFNQMFGMSLKTYCSIVRFKSSLPHIKNGQLFPELNFTDQTHFIKSVKKLSGVTPKELSKNQNGRFILLSVLPKK